MSTLAIGERLMDLRKKRGMSMRDLAQQSGASTSLISQIETGRTNPTVAKLQNLATALGVSVNYFFDSHPEAPPEPESSPGAGDFRAGSGEMVNGVAPAHPGIPLDVVHLGNRQTIDLSEGVTWQRLTPHGRAGIEFLEVTYEVGTDSGPLASHYGEEFVFVFEGALAIEFAFDRVVLGPGDSLAFDSTVPHRVTSVGEVPMRAIWVNWTRVGLREPGRHVHSAPGS